MTRARMPHRRDSRLVDFDHGGRAFCAGYSVDETGALGEVFISGSKSGSDLDALAMDGAVLLSIALQQGSDPADLLASLGRQGFNRPDAPASPIGAALAAALADIDAERIEGAE